MRRSAVIFVLIFTLIITNICTGCGSSASDQGGGPAKTESGGSSDPAGKTDPSGKTSDAGKSDAAGKTGDASSIPDTNESAVTDWGTADAGTSSAADEKKSSSESGPAPAFSQVLIDNDDLYFAIKDVRSDAAYGYEWKIYVENRTDKNLMFSFEKVSVNGVMCDPFWAEVINAGKKGNCEITWMRDSLQEKQIGDVTEVDFTLNVYNDDDYTEAALMHDPFTVFPLGEDKVASAAREPAATDHVLVPRHGLQRRRLLRKRHHVRPFLGGHRLRGQNIVFNSSVGQERPCRERHHRSQGNLAPPQGVRG